VKFGTVPGFSTKAQPPDLIRAPPGGVHPGRQKEPALQVKREFTPPLSRSPRKNADVVSASARTCPLALAICSGNLGSRKNTDAVSASARMCPLARAICSRDVFGATERSFGGLCVRRPRQGRPHHVYIAPRPGRAQGGSAPATPLVDRGSPLQCSLGQGGPLAWPPHWWIGAHVEIPWAPSRSCYYVV